MSSIKLLLAGVVLASLTLGVVYVKSLQSTVETLQQNNATLESSVQTQQALIEQQIEDNKKILEARDEQYNLNNELEKAIRDLEKKFHKINSSGKKRDLGDLATKKTKSVERVINNGSGNALRCLEIAMGSPLTEKEKNATKKSQINPECSDVANPSYVPYSSGL